MRFIHLFLLGALLLVVKVPFSCAQTIIHHPQSSEPLEQRWAWALDQAAQREVDDGYWVGYRIQRLMSEDEVLLIQDDMTIRGHGRIRSSGQSLYELVTGEPPSTTIGNDEAVQREAQRALTKLQHVVASGKKVWKDLAIVLGYEAGADKKDDVDDVMLGNMTFDFDFKGRPVFWLAEANDDESLNQTEWCYKKASTAALKEKMVDVIGVHSAPERVVPFLEDVLTSQADDEVRKEAASWLGYQGDERALDVLVEAARTDRSLDVREEAAESIGEIPTETALQALIELAHDAPAASVREEAVEALGERASSEAIAALEHAAFNDPSVDVQEEAVEAITSLPSSTAMPHLSTIATTHPNAEVREEAVEHLGEVASDDALKLIAFVAFHDASRDVQEEAVEVLADFPEGMGLPLVIKVAESHASREVRQEAIEVLAESNDKRARDALERLLNKVQ